VRKTAIGLAILMFVTLAGFLLAPQFVDVERYRPQIAERISDWSGRPVTLGGPIRLSLIPSPHLSVHDLVVANVPDARAPEMVRVRQVDAAVSFWPLLAGRIEVTSARLLQPVIALERLPDGRDNWVFGKVAVAAPSPSGGAGESRGAPTPLAPRAEGLKVGGLTIKVASLDIEDATISYRSGDSLELAQHVTLKLTGDAVSAPLHAEGNLSLLGMPVAITADMGRLGRAELPLSLKLSAEPAGSADFTGDLLLDGPKPRAKGTFTLESANLAAATALAASELLPPMLAKPVRVAGDIEVAADALALDRFSLELGDIRGDGTLRAALGTAPTIDAKLTINAFDVDRFAAERAASGTLGQGKAAPSSPAATASSPNTGGSREPERWRLPSGLTATIDLGVDAVSWRQGVMRQVRLEATLDGGKLDIRRFGALLPGGTDVSLAGSVDATSAAPRFVGTVRANADNLRDFLRWNGVAVEGVPADRLRRAAISSGVEVDDGVMELRTLDLTFDASHVTGAATIAMRDRIALGARLTIDQLNLDAYVSDPQAQSSPASPSAAAPITPADATGGLTRVTVPQALADALTSFDANMDASVDTLIWRTQPIRKVRVTATLQNRDLTLRELSVSDLGGAQGKLSGFFQGIGTTQPSMQFAFDMRGPELGRVVRLLSSSVASADTFGAFSLGGEVERQAGKFSLDSELELGSGKLHVAGDSPSADTWSLAANLEHPSFNRLMRLVSARYRPQGGELGPVKFDGRLEWSPGSVVMQTFTAAVGDVSVEGGLQVALASRPRLTATLTLNDLAIDKFMPARQTAWVHEPAQHLRPGVMLAQAGSLPARAGARWSTAPIVLDFLSLIDGDLSLKGKSISWAGSRIEDPQIKLALKDSVLGISRVSGRLFGGALAASGSIDASETPRFRLAAQLAGADFKQALASSGGRRLEGSFDLDASLATVGASPQELISRLDGTAALRGRDGTIDGVNIPAVNQRITQVKALGDLGSLLRAATSGSTPFSKLEGSFKLANGIARSEDLHLAAEGGDGTGTATVDLPNWTVLSRTDIRLMGVPGAPPLGLALKGPLEQPDWSLDFSAIMRALASHAVERLWGSQPGTPDQGGAAQSEPAQGDPAKPLKPKDILRNLLKNPP